MENYKKILIFIIILVIFIIFVTVALLMLRKEKVIKEENPPTVAFENIEKLTNRTLFFQIESYIKSYMNYIVKDNEIAINALSPKGRIQIDTTKEYTSFISNSMYTLDKINNITVFVEEIARGKNFQDKYYIVVNMDYTNDTYEILTSSEQEFTNAKNNIIEDKYREDIVVQQNEYNNINKVTLSELQILKKYFDDYKFKAINIPEEAFTIIDATYKKEKFNNDLEQYKMYIQNNINTLKDANIVKHGVSKEVGYTKYTFVDNYGNYYELKETGIYEYTISLDNYTVQTDEQTKKYNSLTDEQKALSNIDKIMKLIDQKDYLTVYNYLNKDFKNKNFPTIEVFTKYMKENFFENNIVGNIGIQNEGNIYMLNVPYKESLSRAAEEMEKNFIMKLNEGTDFEISFDI